HEVVAVDLTIPASPVVARRFTTTSQPNASELRGEDLFLLDASGPLVAGNVTGTTFTPTQTRRIYGDFGEFAIGSEYAYAAAGNGIRVVGVDAAPAIDASRTTTEVDGTEFVVTGAPGAIRGVRPLTVQLRDVTAATSVAVTLDPNGAFTGRIAADEGDEIAL